MTHLLTTIVALTAILAGSAGVPQAQTRRTSGGAALATLGSEFSARVVTIADGDTLSGRGRALGHSSTPADETGWIVVRRRRFTTGRGWSTIETAAEACS